MILSELWIYPVKSLGGIRMPSAQVQRRGLQYDRRWMLVDEQGRFVSQREIPAMALLDTTIDESFLTVTKRDNPVQYVQIPLAPPVDDLPKLRAEIWSEKASSRLLPDSINNWFSDILGHKLRLVWMPETTKRAADGRYAPKGQYVSFADGFPYLIIGQASLDDLNNRLAEPLPMNRFRPNLVFTGGTPFIEDEWRDFRIGEVPFRGVKTCARCVITTINQLTAARAAEPLKTLATFRKHGNKIKFGQNVVWMGTGESAVIAEGMSLTALAQAD